MTDVHFGRPAACGMPDEEINRRAFSWDRVTCQPCQNTRFVDLATTRYAIYPKEVATQIWHVIHPEYGYRSRCGTLLHTQFTQQVRLQDFGTETRHCRQCRRSLDSDT